MGNARKYLALALASCAAKQYEEAGVFLAQAAAEDDRDETIALLGGVSQDSKPGLPHAPDNTESCSSDDFDWGDRVEDPSTESISAVTRRKTTSLFHIGKILGAVISESSEDDGDDEDDEDVDPDFPGSSPIHASFSNMSITSVVDSPIKLR